MYENLFKSDYLVINDNQSKIALVIGWYPLKTMLAKLKSQNLLDRFEVIGNLFNPVMGVDLLIRNLLHNAHISTVVIYKGTHQDNDIDSAGSLKQAIIDYDHFSRVCVSEPKLTKDDYDQISQITVFTCATFETLAITLTTTKPIQSRREVVTKPRIIPIVKSNYPGRVVSQYVEDKTIDNAHIQACNRILTNGRLSVGGRNLLELLNLNICVTGAPKILGELLSVCSPNECEYINGFIHPVQESINYNYGHRLRYSNGDLVNAAIKKIKRKSESLAVYLPVFHSADLTESNSPCLVSVWFRVYNNTLDMFATFRSNDIWKAWKYNALGLRGLQIHIANEACFLVGALHTNSLSAHIYTEDIDQIPVFKHPKTDYMSAVGNFYISVVENRIYVKQYDSTGAEIKTYIQLNPLHMIREICNSNPTIEVDHIGYLGIELQKAKNCLENQLPYVQDYT